MRNLMIGLSATLLISVGAVLAILNIVYPIAAKSPDPDRIEAPAFLLLGLAGFVAVFSVVSMIVSMLFILLEKRRKGDQPASLISQ